MPVSTYLKQFEWASTPLGPKETWSPAFRTTYDIMMASGFGMCAVVVYFLIEGRNDRQREEEAREYFDAHGHWPDEEPTP